MNVIFLYKYFVLGILITFTTCFAVDQLDSEDCAIEQERNFYINFSHKRVLSEDLKVSENQDSFISVSNDLNSIALGYFACNSRFEYELFYFVENIKASKFQDELQLYRYDEFLLLHEYEAFCVI